jgi:hypothetical protein
VRGEGGKEGEDSEGPGPPMSHGLTYASTVTHSGIATYA